MRSTQPGRFLGALGVRQLPACTNVRLEEMLRMETHRRGLHSDVFADPPHRPRRGVRAAG